MVKMNDSRGRGGDDDYGDVGAEPTMPARYPGTCAECGQRFDKGDPIATVVVDKRKTYQHGHCRYPATALLEQSMTEAGVDAGAARRKAPPPGLCKAVTSKGRPCGNAPQKGEQFCGPHLTQLLNRTTAATPRSEEPF
jgi:hypothetical protein